MINILKLNVSDYTVTGEFDIAGSVSEDADAKKACASVPFTLRFVMKDTPLADIIHSSLKDKKINWQSKRGTITSKLTPHQVIVVDYKGGRAPVDVETKLASEIQGMSDEEAAAKEAGLVIEMEERAELSERGTPGPRPDSDGNGNGNGDEHSGEQAESEATGNSRED